MVDPKCKKLPNLVTLVLNIVVQKFIQLLGLIFEYNCLLGRLLNFKAFKHEIVSVVNDMLLKDFCIRLHIKTKPILNLTIVHNAY